MVWKTWGGVGCRYVKVDLIPSAVQEGMWKKGGGVGCRYVKVDLIPSGMEEREGCGGGWGGGAGM